MNLWIVSCLPPPVHGVAEFNRLLLEELSRRGWEYRFYRVGASGSPGTIGRWRFEKAVADATLIANLVVSVLRQHPHDRRRLVLYFTPSQGGFAVVRDFLLTTLLGWLSVRTVAHLHGCGWLSVVHDHRLIGYFMRRTMLNCDAVICLGPTFARKMAYAVGTRCVGINNGYPRTVDCPPRIAPDPATPIELLYLGALLESKGLWEAARAASLLRQRGLHAKLICAGSWQVPAERSRFLAEFGEEIGRGTIVIAGHADQDAKQALLRRANFLLLPTRYRLEGQPLVLIEALRVGLVPLSHDHAGIPDMLRFLGSERLVRAEHGSAEGLAATISSLTADSGAYLRISRACLDHYIATLQFDHCVDQILSVLEREADRTPRQLNVNTH